MRLADTATIVPCVQPLQESADAPVTPSPAPAETVANAEGTAESEAVKGKGKGKGVKGKGKGKGSPGAGGKGVHAAAPIRLASFLPVTSGDGVRGQVKEAGQT